MFGINKEFKRLKNEAAPSQAFKYGLLRQFQIEIKKSCMKQESFARYATVGVISVLIVFGLGTGVYAYESSDVVLGHPLQIVKENMENIEGKIADWQGRPAQFHAKMAERRLIETERHQKDFQKVDLLLTATAEQLGLTIRELHEDLQDPTSREDVLERLTDVNSENEGLVQRFVEFVESHDLEDRPRLQRFMNAGIGDEVSTIREELNDSELSNIEKRNLFQERMKELLDKKKEQVDTRRDELKQQNLDEKEIRDQLREEFGFPPRGPKGPNFGKFNQYKDDEMQADDDVEKEVDEESIEIHSEHEEDDYEDEDEQEDNETE